MPKYSAKRLSDHHKIKQVQWHTAVLIYAKTIMFHNTALLPPWRASNPSRWWLEVTSVHVGTHNYHFPTGGTSDQWESDLPLRTHLLQSQIINWFISPPLPSVLFRGLSEGVHYLFMERRFIQFAGDPIRSSVWMHGKGLKGKWIIPLSLMCGKAKAVKVLRGFI